MKIFEFDLKVLQKTHLNPLSLHATAFHPARQHAVTARPRRDVPRCHRAFAQARTPMTAGDGTFQPDLSPSSCARASLPIAAHLRRPMTVFASRAMHTMAAIRRHILPPHRRSRSVSHRRDKTTRSPPLPLTARNQEHPRASLSSMANGREATHVRRQPRQPTPGVILYPPMVHQPSPLTPNACPRPSMRP